MPKELLIKGGHVVTVDPDLDDLPVGDVLVTDGVITAVGPSLTPADGDVEVIDAGPAKVHFRVQFARYRDDGSPIGSYRSLYIVTVKDDRWAIQCRSSWAA